MTSNAERARLRNIMRARAGVARAKPTRVEEALQEQIVEYFRVAVLQAPGVPLLFAVPNGEARDKVTAGKLVGISTEKREYLTDDEALQPFGLGVLPGTVDLVLLLPAGRSVLVEVKRPEDKLNDRRRGRASRMQRLFAKRAGELGHRYETVESVDQFAELLVSLGIRVRVRWWGPQVVRPGEPPRLPS